MAIENAPRLAAQGAPHGIDLFLYAAVSVDIAEGDRALADVLRDRALTLEQWTEATAFWSQRMAEDARPDASGNVTPRVALLFSDAFARAQDDKRPLVPLSADAWAELVHDAEEASLAEALAKRGLRMADHSRLVRHWAKALATDAALRARYESRRASLGNTLEGV
ncbi:MAG: hypothetical protein KF764_21050 [Labilithrix sp.]|nr:hypothetical protein [Labilithrix sp.]MBX3222269.1 hypothetical protein [Labilithrix sp.]